MGEIIIKGKESVTDGYLNSQDFIEDRAEQTTPDFIKKQAEINTFAIIIDSRKEVPYKIRKPNSDLWYVGKCSRYDWNETYSKFATQITWKTWIEMYTGLPVPKKLQEQLSKAIIGTGIFSVTAKTLKDISHLADSSQVETTTDGLKINT